MTIDETKLPADCEVWRSGDVVLVRGDCLAVLPAISGVDCVVTDPPYPNKAGHFIDGIKAANSICNEFSCHRWFVYWDEMTLPPVPHPLVARHLWHRSNTNRPDNYEAIYEFNADGTKRPSRCFSFAVIYPGLTGCVEAVGHPTQKNLKQVMQMIERCKITGTVFDPFTGSGTTGVACVNLGRKFIGIEISKEYFEIAKARIIKAQQAKAEMLVA